MDHYKLGRLLGQGNFAKVYHGRNLKTGASVAVKVINKEKIMKKEKNMNKEMVIMQEMLMTQIMREISAMRLVKHPNIVQIYEVFATKTKIYLVLEYLKGGELSKKLAKGKLEEATARKYFQQLITAISFCHNQGVYHRDLKFDNLLLDEDGNLKVSDFGLSALAETKWEDGLLHTRCGSHVYMAPEVFYRKPYDGTKADIWSCGVILFALLAGRLPFQDPNFIEMYKKIKRAEFKFPDCFPHEARELVSKVLDPNPITRIPIVKIMENSWFQRGLVSQPRRTVRRFDSFNDSFGERIKDFTDLEKPYNLNAFDIIILSPGFDLSGLFNDDIIEENKLKFMSKQSFGTIVLKLEEIGNSSMLKVVKIDGGLLKMEGLEDCKNDVLDINIEIFEIAHDVHLIEVKRLGGDKVGFCKILNEHIRPALMDVV